MDQRVQDDGDRPRFRSGTVARMAKMPAATLRIWERRYAVSGSAKSSTGQRLYSRGDIDRIVMLKTLVTAGYAIGSIARLGDEELRGLVAGVPHANPQLAMQMTVATVGSGWDPLSADEPAGHWSRYDSLAAASASATFMPIDWLLVRQAQIDAETAKEILDLADRSRASCVAVVYAFGQKIAMDVLRMAGVLLLRERGAPLTRSDILGRVGRWHRRQPHVGGRTWGRAQRRFSNEQLDDIAAMSATLACECPQHLSAIVGQIAGFESYSDECASRSPEDALLHRYLGDVASRARELFEQAVEHFTAVEQGKRPRK